MARGLDDQRIESRWGRDFPHLSRLALGPTQPLVQWVRVFSGCKERPGYDADPSPPSSAWSRKGRAIPLLPLWAARPVQSLSACARVTFIFTFFFIKLNWKIVLFKPSLKRFYSILLPFYLVYIFTYIAKCSIYPSLSHQALRLNYNIYLSK